MPSGIYKRSKKEIQRIKTLRKGLVPWNKNKAWTEEVKLKFRKARLENPISYWKGKKRNIETCKKISKTRIEKEVAVGKKNPNWKGGRRILRKHLYVRINNGYYLYEHRRILQKFLGRKLKSNEIVHHIDNNPLNNSIKNLKIMSRSEHSKLHNQKL